jgi:hypothetical protein
LAPTFLEDFENLITGATTTSAGADGFPAGAGEPTVSVDKIGKKYPIGDDYSAPAE